MTRWQRWVHQPATLPLRKALFQVHLWTGLITSLYILVICVSGSLLVYRNELYNHFTPQAVFVEEGGTPLAESELHAHAARLYPEHSVVGIAFGTSSNQAVEAVLEKGTERIRRLLHPYSGADLGNPVPAGYRFTAWLLDLHDNLLAGETGRKVNGIGGVCVILLCLTGLVIWWSGKGSWRRNLVLDLRTGATFVSSLHKASGIWIFAFLLMWGITGVYLAYSTSLSVFFDFLQPYDPASSEERLVDRIQYWLAYLHFGRLGGRGIAWCDRGLCNSISMGMWAAFALVPPLLVISGTLLWWKRVLKPWLRKTGIKPV